MTARSIPGTTQRLRWNLDAMQIFAERRHYLDARRQACQVRRLLETIEQELTRRIDAGNSKPGRA